MLLDTKTAIVYGAGGAIGSAVARAYAREGAEVHLAGRTRRTLEEVAQRIRHDGGAAHVAEVDVLDRSAVARHADAVAASGGIDICFNATSNDDVQGTPLLEMPFGEFLRPVTKAVTAHFNVAVAVGRHMTRRGCGVILVMAGGREAIPRLGGSHVAWAALAGLCRQLAAEFGPYGVRVSWLLSPGSPGSPGYDDHDGRPERRRRGSRRGSRRGRIRGRARYRRLASRPPPQLRRGRQRRRLRRVRLGPHHHRERDQLHRWRGRGLDPARYPGKATSAPRARSPTAPMPSSCCWSAMSLSLIMKIGPLPDALPDALDPGFHCARPHWIRGFMAFQLARRTRSVMLMVPT